MRIIANNADRTGETADILIGLVVHATALIDGPPEWRQNPTYQWSVQGHVLEDYQIAADESFARTVPLDDGHAGDAATPPSPGLKQREVQFFWASTTESPKLRDLSVTVGNINGQSHGASAKYNVYEPMSTGTASLDTLGMVDDPNRIGLFRTAGGFRAGIVLEGSVQVPADFGQGDWHIVQKWTPGRHRTSAAGGFHSPYQGVSGLDNWHPYLAVLDPYVNEAWPTGPDARAAWDEPYMPLLEGSVENSMDDWFETFMMFRPAGPDSRWVPLRRVTWSIKISAVPTPADPTVWVVDRPTERTLNGQPVPNQSQAPFLPTIEFPEWEIVHLNNAEMVPD